MRKYKSVDFQFDPEIERTARRLRREHRELQAAVAMDDLQNLRNLNCKEGIQLVNVHEGLNGQCVQRQPGNNNIIHMANDRDRAIRDYAVLTPQAIHPGIVRPNVQDPHLHLKLFLEVSDAFKIAGALQEPLRLILFPFSLIDRARAWLNSLPPDSITTWSDLADKVLLKYFPPTKNAKLRNEITSFHQLEDESLCDARERFKELLRKCPHHGISCCIQLETFYNGLNPSTRLMVDASTNGALLSKSYNEAYEILERIANNNYQWPSTRQAAARGTAGVHNVDALTTLAAQVTSLTMMVKAMTTAPATINQISDMSCVYCGEWHLFDNCPALSNRPQGSLPSNTEDPKREGKEHCKVINLRSGKDVHTPVCVPKRRVEPTSIQKETQIEKKSQSSTSQYTGESSQAAAFAENDDPTPVDNEAVAPTQNMTKEKQSAHPATVQQFRHPPPFPQRFQKQQQDKQFSKIWRVLKQLHINIPFVEALEQMPNYAKIFKDILTKKRKLGEFETVALTQECSRMVQSTKYSGKALCDLGASINLMPLSVFKQLGVGECRPTTVSLQLAGRSHAYPEGKIEYVLVKQVTFNVLDVMKSPDEIENYNFISVMDFVVAERLHSCCSKEEINYVTIEELDDEDHGAANIAWLGEKQHFKIDEQIQQRELTPEQQEFKGNRPRVKHYMGDDVNSLRKDRFLKDPG
ncbi:hypothetical protein KPL70_000947 [Citrus sinensis]|nr:hypothetical protein KPL70_000947 [Citrus sinensis]